MKRVAFFLNPFLFLFLVSLRGQISHAQEAILGKEKVTHLHFYFHDVIRGDNPMSVMVAHANQTAWGGETLPFGTTYALDNPLTEGPELTSKVVGNVQGLYISTDKERLALVLAADLGFTDGEFNGSSISVFSRNPVLESPREVAVVGGRGKFRYARGFAILRNTYFNVTNGDSTVEYNVTVLHYAM